MKKIGDEIQFSYRVEKVGKMGIEGVKQYFLQPEVLGNLIGSTAGLFMAATLRPQYELDIQLPRKIRVKQKPLFKEIRQFQLANSTGNRKMFMLLAMKFKEPN
jgi:hypothetical protein